MYMESPLSQLPDFLTFNIKDKRERAVIMEKSMDMVKRKDVQSALEFKPPVVGQARFTMSWIAPDSVGE